MELVRGKCDGFASSETEVCWNWIDWDSEMWIMGTGQNSLIVETGVINCR